MKFRILFFFTSIAMISCTDSNVSEFGDVQGYVPVYAPVQQVTAISTEQPQPTVKPGKIYAYGSYLFQVEQNEGIHIISNSGSQSKKIAFLKIPTCSELAIKSNYLYTNNTDDLVVFDISNISSPQLVKRLENAFPQFGQTHPPFSNVYFECPDPEKGMVIGWEQQMINNPKCRR